MNRIVVAHIITKLELGGAQINTLHTWRHLDPQRFDAWLLCGPGGPLQPDPAASGRLLVCPELQREIRPWSDLRALWSIRRQLRHLRPRIVHTHSSKAGILGRLAARLAGVKLVVHTVHGFSFAPGQSFLKKSAYRLAERLAAPLTDHVIFVAENDRRQAIRMGLCKDDGCSVIRSGFPMQRFLAPPADGPGCRQRFDVPAGRPLVGIIAPFKPQKGLFHLTEIAARVIQKRPDVLFLIAGDGEQRSAIEADLARRGISANFRLPGFIPDIENAISLFTIGVSTALWEGLPQSLVQMRLMKKALVVSDIPGNREVVRQGENGFVVPLVDPDAFAARILRLLEDEALRTRLGLCPDDFSEWDADLMVRRQEALYLRLLNES
jgi:glycosyltransferase involved in cell wall biosynthesis